MFISGAGGQSIDTVLDLIADLPVKAANEPQLAAVEQPITALVFLLLIQMNRTEQAVKCYSMILITIFIFTAPLVGCWGGQLSRSVCSFSAALVYRSAKITSCCTSICSPTEITGLPKNESRRHS